MDFILKDQRLAVTSLPEVWLPLLPAFAAEKLRIPSRQIAFVQLLHSSIDSRRGAPELILTLHLRFTSPPPRHPALSAISKAELANFTAPELPLTYRTSLQNPLVIGSGPAGISAAYILALAGCAPIIIDRGEAVEARVASCRRFVETRILNEESNLLLGEGGAGTFSDGKLYTGTKDIRARWLKKLWVECGAPAEILHAARGHIGSDKLIALAAGLRQKIEALGGKFLFRSAVTGIICRNRRCCGVKLASGEVLETPAVIFAPGLGGRDLLRQLCKLLPWEFKAFQSGCRIEHPQTLIDRAMYHLPSRPAALGAAEYHLLARHASRPVSSFCMCPGGTVVNATAWQGRSISNGMSCFARDGEFANSCLIATFQPAEFGSPEEFFRTFDTLEKSIFTAGGSDYTLPAQDASAFLAGKNTLRSGSNSSQCGIVPARLDQLLLPELTAALRTALPELDRKLPGFIASGRFIGAESFVSSPLRLLRDRLSFTSPGCDNFYPAGEGCGLAGGIVSAACDGIRCAEAMLRAFAL